MLCINNKKRRAVMKIYRGSYRKALIFKNFVIKFPRIFPLLAIKGIYKRARKRYLLMMYLKAGIYSYTESARKYLLRGILENWREFTLYYRCRSKLLAPTYFSLFGLLNIQRAGKEIDVERVGYLLLGEICRITNNDHNILKDAHHFSNPRNFCEKDGRLMMIDYGSEYARRIVEKYGNKIVEEFDFKGLMD
jgi:hypothetical protein